MEKKPSNKKVKSKTSSIKSSLLKELTEEELKKINGGSFTRATIHEEDPGFDVSLNFEGFIA